MRALTRQLARVEAALAIAPDDHAGETWISPKQSKAIRARMLDLVAGLHPEGSEKQAALRERIRQMCPEAGYWTKPTPPDGARIRREFLAELRATAGKSPWQDASR